MPVRARVSLKRVFYLLVWETTWRATIWHTGMKYLPLEVISMNFSLTTYSQVNFYFLNLFAYYIFKMIDVSVQ